MQKGKVWGVEAILFSASLVLCVVCAFSWVKRDDGAFKDVIEKLDHQEARIKDLETREREDVSPEPQILNVHLKEPVSVNVVYTEREGTKVPPQIDGKKSKTPLMDRARKVSQ